MRTMNEPVFSGDASSSFFTTAVDLDQKIGFSIQASILDASLNGTISLQGSNDYGRVQPAGPSNGSPDILNWTDISGSFAPVTGDGTVTWNSVNTFYRWVRVNYVATSGTGNIDIRIQTKGF